jgi:hypothetical protein
MVLGGSLKGTVNEMDLAVGGWHVLKGTVQQDGSGRN